MLTIVNDPLAYHILDVLASEHGSKPSELTLFAEDNMVLYKTSREKFEQTERNKLRWINQFERYVGLLRFVGR